MAKSRQHLVILDSHALIHRAYHALPPMTTRSGQPTNAAYGFATMLFKVLTTLKPTHLVAAFDLGEPTIRHEAFADYKAHRKPVDDDLVSQFPVVRRVLEAFSIPVLEAKGYEADDVAATVAASLEGSVATTIVTGDVDLLQLVTDTTSVYMLRRGVSDMMLYTPELVKEKFGFEPQLVPDYKGLRGDPSDNIPGVAGIGEKTALDLVSTYGPIETIYEHLDEVTKRAQTRLRGHKKEALFSRKLATVEREVPVTFSLEEAEFSSYDTEAVHRLFEELEFKSLLGRLPKNGRSRVQPTLFKDEVGSDSDTLPEHYHVVVTPEEQQALRDELLREKVIAFDTETTELGARTCPIIGMSFAVRRDDHIVAWYVPVDRQSVKAWKDLFENPAIGKVGHNLKYDYAVLRQSDITLEGIVFDSMIASYLLHPDARQHGLDTLAVQELGHTPIPITDLIGSGKDQKLMSDVPLLALARYAAEDADVSFRLYEKLNPKIVQESLTTVLTDLELPLIPVLAEMELCGIKVDKEALSQLATKGKRRIAVLQKKIWEAAGSEFNINSTQQLRKVLYEDLALSTDGITRTQSGYSTAASELEKLRGKHEIVELLEEYRERTKLQNTYIETLPRLIDPETGRIHASFNQTVAATGRLSSSDPNLQNIPVRTELGQEIRAAFVAERGKRLVKADYSQLELRIAAHLGQDEKMLEAFRSGEDIHRSTAAWVHGVAPDEVTSAQRRMAKTLNFGVLYGMGPQNFSRAAGISLEEARSFIERYRQQYTGIVNLINETLVQAEELGYVETLSGRRRYVPEIHASAPRIRAQAERAAFNFPIQGTAADILKKAMIVLHDLIKTTYPETFLMLSVHDELVCEVPHDQAEAFAQDLIATMEGVYSLDVPLTVEASIGKNWRDMS